MTNKVIPMQQVRSVIQLLEKGLSLRAIATALHLSRLKSFKVQKD
jgi:hypothetical protein